MKCVVNHAKYVVMASTHFTILRTMYIQTQTQPSHATGLNATNVYNTYIEPTYVLGCAVCDVRMVQPLSERNVSVHIDARLYTTSVSAFHCLLSDLFIRSLRRSHLRNSHLFTTTMATQRRHASIFLVLVMNGAFNYKNTYMKKKPYWIFVFI